MSRYRRWPMATRRCVGIAALVLMAFGVPFVSQAIAQEPAKSGALSRTLEAANLSPEGRALLRAKGTEVVRAGVEEGEVAGLIQRGVARGIQPAELVSLLDVVARAKRQDLPVGPVLDKVNADLVSMGLSPREASETVGAALVRGLSRRDIEGLRERLGQAMKRGGSADAGAKQLREEIRSERPEKADKLEKTEKPEKMEKPEKPPKVERPGR